MPEKSYSQTTLFLKGISIASIMSESCNSKIECSVVAAAVATKDEGSNALTESLTVAFDDRVKPRITVEEEFSSSKLFDESYFAEAYRNRYPRTNSEDDESDDKKPLEKRHSYEYWATKTNSSDRFSDGQWAKLVGNSLDDEQRWGI